MTIPARALGDMGSLLHNPDLTAELNLCLDTLDPLLVTTQGAPTARDLLIHELQDAFMKAAVNLGNDKSPAVKALAALLPAPPTTVDVQSACSGNPSKERIGIWLQPTNFGALVRLRQTKLPLIDLLPTNLKKLSINVPLETITLFIQAIWEFLASQNGRLNSKGSPDASGAIQLRSWNLSSPTPQSYALVVNGTYHETVPKTSIEIDVDFVLTITETFGVMQSGGASWISSSSQRQISLDESGIKTAEAALGFLSQFFGLAGWGPFLGLYAQIEEAVDSALQSISLPPISLGKVILSVLPSQILVPNLPLKVNFFYDGVGVAFNPGGDGLTVTGSKQPAVGVRQPGLLIGGSRNLQVNVAVNKGPTVTSSYSLLTLDMRPPLNPILWSGDGTFSSATAWDTNITFPLKGAPSSHKITVTATDADGTTATTSATISISTYSQAPNPPEGTGHGPKRQLES